MARWEAARRKQGQNERAARVETHKTTSSQSSHSNRNNRTAGKPENDSLTKAYETLGCSPAISDSELKKIYHELMKEYHPDKVSAAGLGRHIIRDAEEKAKLINDAYHTILEYRAQHR